MTFEEASELLLEYEGEEVQDCFQFQEFILARSSGTTGRERYKQNRTPAGRHDGIRFCGNPILSTGLTRNWREWEDK